MELRTLSYTLAPVFTVGLIGSILRSYTTGSYSLESVLISVIMQILIALLCSLIILLILRSMNDQSGRAMPSFISIYTWTYFVLGLFGFLSVIS